MADISTNVGMIFQVLFWLVILILSIYLMYQIIQYLRQKPPNMQTLLDGLYIQMFCIWIFLTFFGTIFYIVVALNIKDNTISFIVGNASAIGLLLSGINLMMSCAYRIILISNPTMIAHFLDNDILKYSLLTNMAISLAIPTIFWLTGIQVPGEILIQHGFDPKYISLKSPSTIILRSFWIIGFLSQLLLRAYLKFVKKFEESHELLKWYTVIILGVINFIPPIFSNLLGVSLYWIGILIILLQYVMIPAMILLRHENARQYYFSSHPKLHNVVLSIEQLLNSLFVNCFPQPQEPEAPAEVDDMALESNLKVIASQAATRIAIARQAAKTAQLLQTPNPQAPNPKAQNPQVTNSQAQHPQAQIPQAPLQAQTTQAPNQQGQHPQAQNPPASNPQAQDSQAHNLQMYDSHALDPQALNLQVQHSQQAQNLQAQNPQAHHPPAQIQTPKLSTQDPLNMYQQQYKKLHSMSDVDII